MARFGNVAEHLQPSWASLMQIMLSMHLHYGRRVSRLQDSLQNSVSHIILLVMYQRGTLMTFKQVLIQQVSCWLEQVGLLLLQSV